MSGRLPARACDRVRLGLVVVLVAVVAGLIGSLVRYLSIGIETGSFGFDCTAAPDGVGAAPLWRRLLVAGLAGLVCGCCWWRIRRRPRGMPPGIAQAVDPDPARRARMPALVDTADALAQLLIVGAGMSLGREAAPRILAAIGGQAVLDRTGVGEETRRLLIGSAAGAGLAAIYNAPVAAALYTIELVLHPDLRTRRGWAQAGLTGLICGIATLVSWVFNRNRPIYELPTSRTAAVCGPWALVVVVAALVAGRCFNALIGVAKKYAPPTRMLIWTVPLGALAVAGLAVWQPRIVGNGQVVVQAVITGGVPLPALAVLLLAKACGTAVGLVTGSTGGLLTPSLAVGACLGACLGGVARLDPATTMVLAITGAGCVLALNQKAPFFGALFAIELTRAPLSTAITVLAAVGILWRLDLLVCGVPGGRRR
ncbi:chloride channel protein [uncultured Propionibacterium sp.]|uniref:chloride channel protein n=1 Tax=uncultured Propionibacterium sp. TaxID=218066 RepID=UPI00292DEA54|nr:chloride channel protein [uncultured Propionibacterium sp.]